MLAIQTPIETPFWTQRVVLDGSEFFVRCEFNQREGRWYLGLADQDESVIFAPRKLVSDWDLLRTISDARAPRGALIATDTSGQGLDAGFSDLGVRVLLVYFTAAEVEAARAGST
jgi:hypothetical protein